VPLPLALLAAMGFVGVFAGATHTPLACTIMALELFGLSGFVFFAIACLTAYLASGNKGIYSAQNLGFKKPF
jgi:H+/Cl- antiporter ClcA